MSVVGEWIWGIVSGLAGLVAVLMFSVWILTTRIPTPDQLFTIGEQLIDAKISEWGVNPQSAGGRPREGIWGFLEAFLQTPQGQEIAGNFLGGITGGSGGSYNPGLLRR